MEIDGLCRCNRMILDQRHISRTRTGTNSIAWWKGGVEKNGVLFAHAPEPKFSVYGGRGPPYYQKFLHRRRERKSTVKNEKLPFCDGQVCTR